jgi:hypothetical protein
VAAQSRGQDVGETSTTQGLADDPNSTETVVEKRRRLAALGMGSAVFEDSSDEEPEVLGKPRVPPFPARAAVPPTSSRGRRVSWDDEVSRG